MLKNDRRAGCGPRSSRRRLSAAVLSSAVLAMASASRADELIVNGGFETGDLTGWTVSDLAGGNGSFLLDDADGSTPTSANASVGPAAGSFYAVSDQTGPGTHALIQSFTVLPGTGSVTLSFRMFVNDWSGAGPIVDPIGLDHTGPANQHGRVDILTGASSAFDTGAGVVTNLYIGNDPAATNPNPYASYQFDLTPFVGAGGTFQLRFAEVDNQLYFNVGVDDVSIVTTSVGCPSVPETGCTAADKGSLSVRENKPGKEAVKVSLKKLSAQVLLTDLGDPVSGSTAYDVCLYDGMGALAGELRVDRAGESCGTPAKPCWKAIATKGFKYSDKLAAASGVRTLGLFAGDAGKGKVRALAKNDAAKGQNALPTGIAAALAGSPQATVQVLADDGGCFELVATDVTKDGGSIFKAVR
jgi:hypothetical protein